MTMYSVQALLVTAILRRWACTFASVLLNRCEERVRGQFRLAAVQWAVAWHARCHTTAITTHVRLRRRVDAAHIVRLPECRLEQRPAKPDCQGSPALQGRQAAKDVTTLAGPSML